MNSPPSFPPLCEAEKSKVVGIQFLTPPLCEAKMRMGGEFKEIKGQ